MLCQQKIFSDPTESLAMLHARRAIRNLTYKKKRVDIDALEDEFAASLDLADNKGEQYAVCILYARAVKRIIVYESLNNRYDNRPAILNNVDHAKFLLKTIVEHGSNLFNT